MFEYRMNLTIHIAGSKKDEYKKSKVLGFDLLRVEIFYPYCEENNNMKHMVLKIVVLASHSWVYNMRNSKKTVYHYLSSIKDEKSWVNTSDEENLRLLGSFATVSTILTLLFKISFYSKF